MITDREIALEKEVVGLQRLVAKMQMAMTQKMVLDIDARDKAVAVEIEKRSAQEAFEKVVAAGPVDVVAKTAQSEIAALERDRVHGSDLRITKPFGRYEQLDVVGSGKCQVSLPSFTPDVKHAFGCHCDGCHRRIWTPKEAEIAALKYDAEQLLKPGLTD